MKQILPKYLFGGRVCVSLFVLMLSMVGILIDIGDLPKDENLFALEYIEHFELVFFGLTAMLECVAIGVYLRLWNEVKTDRRPTATILSQGDAMYSSLFTLLRIFWTIGSSIYIVARRVTDISLIENPSPEI